MSERSVIGLVIVGVVFYVGCTWLAARVFQLTSNEIDGDEE